MNATADLSIHKVRLRPAALDIHEAIPFVLKICASERAANLHRGRTARPPGFLILSKSKTL